MAAKKTKEERGKDLEELKKEVAIVSSNFH